MDKKLKQQLKLTYTAPPPKRKEAFFKQIESQRLLFKQPLAFTDKSVRKRSIAKAKPCPSMSLSFLKYQKWVWTTMAMGLLALCVYPKSSTTEYTPPTVQYTSSCGEHIWICVEEISTIDGKRHVHSQCINCMKTCVTIEDVTVYKESVSVSNEEELYVSKEDNSR